MILNEDYIVSKFYQYAGYPKYNRLSRSYYGGCPTCREGSSWGKKRRLYYVVKKNLLFCHNCGLNLRPMKWIMSVSGMNYAEIMKESKGFIPDEHKIAQERKEPATVTEIPSLPEDSINLCDTNQIDFYKDNEVVQKALSVIRARRLDSAINKPQTFWISLTDRVHRNRLIIPFYDVNNKIVHYQSRTIIEQKKITLPKYLSKSNSEKTLFGINNVSDKHKRIFITEGPLDACFLRNGIAVAGINEGRGEPLTGRQKEQLRMFPTHEIVWVLDNQLTDIASRKKTDMLLKQGYSVFLWPKELKKFKDINELCIAQKLNSIEEKFILKHIGTGLKGKMLLSQLA